LRPGAVFVIETLDKDHGNAYDEWIRMGKPHSPTRAETEHLRQYAQQTLKETMCADAEGTLVIRREISPWSLILISEL
jgi:xylan 1,4-beta-xylosidase